MERDNLQKVALGTAGERLLTLCDDKPVIFSRLLEFLLAKVTLGEVVDAMAELRIS